MGHSRSLARWLLVSAAFTSCSGGIAVPSGAPTTPPSSPSSPPAASRTPTPDPATLPRCTASQLRTVAAWTETADALAGGVFIANRGIGPCTVRGNPRVSLLAADGSALDVRMARVTGTAQPTAIVVPVSEFRQDPAGLTGAAAVAPLLWSNYCDDVLATRFTVTLPDSADLLEGAFVDLTGRPITFAAVPRCDDAGGTSTLAVYPFQEPR